MTGGVLFVLKKSENHLALPHTQHGTWPARELVPVQTWKKCLSDRGHVLLTIKISAKRHIKIVP